jgi:hypothetical protein
MSGMYLSSTPSIIEFVFLDGFRKILLLQDIRVIPGTREDDIRGLYKAFYTVTHTVLSNTLKVMGRVILM